MEKLIPLLEKLSQKLGTTVDHLWEVLKYQALISGIMDLVQYAILVVACIYWWKFFKSIRILGWEDGWYWVLGVIGVVLLILVVVAFLCIQTTASAFLNSEYWALRTILQYLK